MKIKKVYLGQQQIRPGKPVYTLESIVTKQKANSSWNIYIPYWDTNWKVSIDYNVVQNWWSATSFSWYTADSEHIVAIDLQIVKLILEQSLEEMNIDDVII